MENGIKLRGFQGKVAAVTGAGQGIGQAIAELFVDLGASVAALDLSAVAPPDYSEAILWVPCDVGDLESVDQAFQTIEAELGHVSILINNAGILESALIHEMETDSWDRIFRVNTKGAFLCSRRAIPPMRDAGYGRIVTLGSSAGKNGGARRVGAYGASKAAVMTLSKAIASENADRGITSNALAPALIDTEMVKAGSLEDLINRIPVGRLGTTEDVAYAAAFLASSDAGYITGEVIDVNGGFLID